MKIEFNAQIVGVRCYNPQLTLEADIGNFPEATVVGARTIAIQWVTVRISIADTQNEREIDFVLQSAHLDFLSEEYLANSVVGFGLAIGIGGLLVRVSRWPKIFALRVVAEQKLAT